MHPFDCPTRVLFGAGAAAQAGERLAELGVRRALVVSDPGVAAAGIVDRIVAAIRAGGVEAETYTETRANPTTTNCEAAAALYRDRGCDGLVGLGGGSAMDAAKGAGILLSNGGDIRAYSGRDNVPQRVPPLLCLPTTCGTGSEVTFNAVISAVDDHFKLVYVTRRIAADVALVDPELVIGAPSHVIAATAADALAHAVEAIVNTGADPLLDALDLGAVRLIGRSMRRAVHARDPEAVAELTLAATMAGIAFNMSGNAIVHAASTPVTAHYDVPHGVANAIFMVPGLEFCLPACPGELAAVAEALGEDVRGLEPLEAGRRGIEAIRTLFCDVGLPATLREFGLDPARVEIPKLIPDALKSRNIALNPRPVGPDDLEALYKAVLG